MATVRFTHTDSWIGEIPTESWEYTIPKQKRYGVAVFRIPEGHAVRSSRFINKSGGFLVSIYNEALGVWNGIVNQRVRIEQDGTMTVTAVQQSVVVEAPVVLGGVAEDAFMYAPAGLIAKSAVISALTGNAHLNVKPGTFLLAPPAVPQFSLTDIKTLGDILSDLEEQSGQTWEIDENSNFNWVADAGRFHENLYCQGADFDWLGTEYHINEKLSYVVGINRNGQRWTASAPITAEFDAWPKAGIISVDTIDETVLRLEVEAAIAANYQARITHRLGFKPAGPRAGRVTADVSSSTNGIPFGLVLMNPESAYENYRNIREGDYLLIMMPKGDLDPICRLVQVTERKFGDNFSRVECEVQEIPDFDSFSVQAAIRNTRIVPVPVQGSELAAILARLPVGAGGTASTIATIVKDANIDSMQAAKLLGRLTYPQIESVSAPAIQPGNLANNVKLRPEDLRTGTMASGVTIGGAQISGPVASATSASSATTAATATNLASLAGLPNGATPVGVTVTGAQVTSPVANASLAAAVAAGGVDAAALANRVVGTAKTDLTRNNNPGLSAGAAESVPATPKAWVQVTMNDGTTGWAPIY